MDMVGSLRNSPSLDPQDPRVAVFRTGRNGERSRMAHFLETPEEEGIVRMSNTIHRYVARKAARKTGCVRKVGQRVRHLEIWKIDMRDLSPQKRRVTRQQGLTSLPLGAQRPRRLSWPGIGEGVRWGLSAYKAHAGEQETCAGQESSSAVHNATMGPDGWRL